METGKAEQEDVGPAGSAIDIRPFDPAHFHAAHALWQRTEGIGLNDADSEEGIRGFLERNPGMSAVAIHRGRLIGAVLCGHDGRRGYLHHLAVEASFRGKGAARQMVRWCESRLLEAGIDHCNIVLFDTNEQGKRFWQHLGWQPRPNWELHQKPLKL